MVLVNTVSIGGFSIGREDTLTFVVAVPGASVGDAVVVTPPAPLIDTPLALKATVDQDDRVLVGVTNAEYGSVFNSGFSVAGGVWSVTVIKRFTSD